MTKPNIVFILADDLGSWALGTNGNNEIVTPNIDFLAQEGVKFDNFFCVSPVCSPARASLLTGKIPSQHGIHDWLHDAKEGNEDIEYLEGQIAYTDVLSQNGYRCGLSGKWHVGKSSKVQKGFEHFFAHSSGSGPYYDAPFYRNGKFEVVEGYVTDAITDDALTFIKDSYELDTPFYLQVGFTAPHSPWLNNHPKRWTEVYEHCPFSSIPKEPINPDSIYLTDMVHQDLNGNLVGYYAATSAMDENIGRIINYLESLDILENTLVIFSSDNGFSCGHHGFWGKGNGTFPINMFEESVKVPFIVYQKGKVIDGLVSNKLVSAYDVFPTLLDYAGIDYQYDSTYPGKSFANDFTKEDDTMVHEAIFGEYGPNRMIRDKEYKYIIRFPYGPDEMYNLKVDPKEKKNMLKEYNDYFNETCNNLRFGLDSWFFKYVNPSIDGSREAVYGSGQINRAGLWSKGHVSQAEPDFVIRDEHYSK